MEENDRKIAEKEIDKIIDKFNNEEFISQNFINFSKTMRDSFFRNLKLHRKSRECEVIGCNQKTILKSHSIPKSSILQNISSNGYLLKPEFDLAGSFPQINMVEVGLKNASIFPGFCEKHENIFKSYESDGKIDNPRKALLQTYRTICRERVFRKIEAEINEITKEEYKKKINDEALKSIKETLSQYPQFTEIEKIDIKGVDSAINSLNKLSNYISKPLPQLQEFEKNILSWLLNIPINNQLIVRVTSIDIHLPVSICGLANQNYIEKGVKRNAYILLNVMPKKDSTDIVCVGLEQDKTIIKKYFDFFFDNPMNTINMIESFMINGSDHWFINPDFWRNIPEKRQLKILYDILFTEDSFLDEYPISIFDDIRLKLISILQENKKIRGLEMSDIEKKRISIEMLKIEQTDFNMITDKEVLIEKIIENFNKH